MKPMPPKHEYEQHVWVVTKGWRLVFSSFRFEILAMCRRIAEQADLFFLENARRGPGGIGVFFLWTDQELVAAVS